MIICIGIIQAGIICITNRLRKGNHQAGITADVFDTITNI